MSQLTNTQNKVALVGDKLPTYANIADLKAKEKALPVPRSMDDLIAVDSRQFIFVAKTFGVEEIELIVLETITEICQYMNMEITGNMVAKAAELIVMEYPLCKIADLKMFENFMCTGKAGKLFRLDTPTILECFQKYNMEREEAFAIHRENEHAKQKKLVDVGKLPSDERMKELLQKAKLKAVEKYEEKKEQQAVKLLSPQEICERHGIDYNALVEEQNKIWHDTWKKSGISKEMEYGVFRGIRKNILDNNIRAGKVFTLYEAIEERK